MKTFQDYETVKEEDEKKRMQFIRDAITAHEGTDRYKTACDAIEYDKRNNVTIRKYQKLLYEITGEAVPDNYSANWKMTTGIFHRIISQEVQYLLGNGASWESDDITPKLGRKFDVRLIDAAKSALLGGVSFVFWNLDHIEVFDMTNFVPLLDEEDGSIRCGIRYWQLDDLKPFRATLYEEDGYTDYIWRKGKGEVLHEKRGYIAVTQTSEADGTEIIEYKNYPGFPIIPLYGNTNHQSELCGIRSAIDCYDFLKSGFANDVDDTSLVYWTIANAGGMDDIDVAKFINHMKRLGVAALEETGAVPEAHSIAIPHDSVDAILDRIKEDLFDDAMALDVKGIASGAITATQIKAAYELLNSKCDDFEYCVLDFMESLFDIAGIEYERPTFTRSAIVNNQEELSLLVAVASYLSNEYVTRKILELYGDGDKADEMLKQMQADEMMIDRDEDEPEEEQTDEGPEGAGGVAE